MDQLSTVNRPLTSDRLAPVCDDACFLSPRLVFVFFPQIGVLAFASVAGKVTGTSDSFKLSIVCKRTCVCVCQLVPYPVELYRVNVSAAISRYIYLFTTDFLPS